MAISEIVRIALQEDLGERGDVTSQACLDAKRTSQAKVMAKQPGIIAGSEFFLQVFKHIDAEVKVHFLRTDGERVVPGDKAAVLTGKSRSILAGERTAMNFIGHLSGVATLTARLVKLVEGTGVTILDTRKTLPGLRLAEKAAVRFGGGANHRIGLYDMMLIKENHIAAAGGIKPALAGAHKYNQENNTELKIEIEVTDIEELMEALKGKPDRIMLDNFSVEQVREAVKIAKGKAELEISGGINESNIRVYAETGADFISVGKITASAPALDLSMLIESNKQQVPSNK